MYKQKKKKNNEKTNQKKAPSKIPHPTKTFLALAKRVI